MKIKPIALARQYKNYLRNTATPPSSETLERARQAIGRSNRLVSQRASQIKNSAAGRQITRGLQKGAGIADRSPSPQPELTVAGEAAEGIMKGVLKGIGEAANKSMVLDFVNVRRVSDAARDFGSRGPRKPKV